MEPIDTNQGGNIGPHGKTVLGNLEEESGNTGMGVVLKSYICDTITNILVTHCIPVNKNSLKSVMVVVCGNNG